MSRHKGRTITKLVERYFPHHVDMMVPEFGLGAHQAASKFVVQSLLGILWFPLRLAEVFYWSRWYAPHAIKENLPMADFKRPERHGRRLMTATIIFGVVLTAAWLCFLGYGMAWLVENAN